MLQVGSDIAIRHYWDLGRWAELWRVWRTPADDRHRDEPLDLKVISRFPFLGVAYFPWCTLPIQMKSISRWSHKKEPFDGKATPQAHLP